MGQQYLKDLRKMRELKQWLLKKQKEMLTSKSSWGNGYALAVEEVLKFFIETESAKPTKLPKEVPYEFHKKLKTKNDE